jgi:hypothetical protein
MTDIARREAASLEHTATPQAAARLVEWAQAARAAHAIAESLVQTGFVPKDYRGKPAEATAAILAGAELGFDPMASLRTFDNIQGTAAPKAITLRAVVQSNGHELDIVEEDEQHAVARYRRRGDDDYKFVTWTIERAKKLGLPQKNPNWNTQPQNMLVARATAEAARRCASDAILGIPYSAEELRDAPETVVQAPSRRVTAAEVLGKHQTPEPAPEVSTVNVAPTGPPDPADDSWPEVQLPGMGADQ